MLHQKEARVSLRELKIHESPQEKGSVKVTTGCPVLTEKDT
jgi:hypothetical protein